MGVRVLVFGGTAEGRELVEWLAGRGCDVVAYSATEYGRALVAGGPRVEARVGPLGTECMEALMREGGFACAVDATHPYAAKITADVAAAARKAGLPVLRLVREEPPEGPWTRAADAAEAACIVAGLPGAVLLTTGAKELPVFTAAIGDYAERLYVRVLPVVSSVGRTRELGIPPAHVIAMQGPFSKELNRALIDDFGIRTLVTKASGAAGGFWEKVGAAEEAGIACVVIDRPTREEGLSLRAVKRQLEESYGI